MEPILPPSAQAIPHSAIRNPQSPGEAERLRRTAQEFEGVFLGLLLKAMRGSVGSGGLFKEGTDAQVYREMFDQEIGRSLARAGGIGLAQIILRDQALRHGAEGNQATRQSGNLAIWNRPSPECRVAKVPDCHKSPKVLPPGDRYVE
jgi:flagellar protein FlgJ